MAFSQADLNAIAAAQAAHPSLPAGYLQGMANLETGGSADPNRAASGTGPVGLLQVAPSTYQNPGYGLPSHNVTREQAIAALQDPNINASFAADYISALQANKGSLDAATRAYSGGGYGQDKVFAQIGSGGVTAGSEALSGTGTCYGFDPSTGSYTSPIPCAPGDVASGASSPTATPSTGNLLTPVWELMTRAGIFMLGGAILLVAIIAMLWHSSTIEVHLDHLTEAA